MITSLQQFLQKHRRWIFAALLIIVVIPFVFTIGASPGIASGKRKAKRFFSSDLNSPSEMENLRRETVLSLYLSGMEGAQLDQAMLGRAFWRWLVDQLQIPRPTKAQLDAFLHTFPSFLEKGKFSEKKYGMFLHSMRQQPGLGDAWIRRVAEDDWRINLALAVLSSSNFTQSREALLRAQHLKTQWSIAVATLPYGKFCPDIHLEEKEIRDYFESHRNKFTTREKISLGCAFFPINPSIDGKATDDELLKFCRKNRELFENKGIFEKDFPKDRGKIEKAYGKFRRKRDASERAEAFIYRLYVDECNGNSPSLKTLSETENGIWSLLEAEGGGNAPASMDISMEAWKNVESLDMDNFVSPPIESKKGSYVFVLRGRTEPQQLTYEEARKRVETYCIKRKRVNLFVKHARETRESIEEKMKKNVSFATAAAESGCSIRHFEHFSVESLPHDLSAQLFARASHLPAGGISPCIWEKPDVKILHVYKKVIPPEDDIPTNVTKIARKSEKRTGRIFLGEWVQELMRKELER